MERFQGKVSNFDLNLHILIVKAFTSVSDVYSVDDLEIYGDSTQDFKNDYFPVKEFISSSDKLNYLHEGSSIESMFAIKGSVDQYTQVMNEHDLSGNHNDKSARYVVGDSSGNIGIWRMIVDNSSISGGSKTKKNAKTDKYYMFLVKYLNIKQLTPEPKNTKINSVCWKDGYILIGTVASEIYEVSEDKFKLVNYHTKDSNYMGLRSESKKDTPKIIEPINVIDAKKLITSHSAGDVWGLAMHPSKPIFITTGDDSTLKVWNLETNRLISFCKLPDKARSVDIHPLAKELALAMNTGDVFILHLDLLMEPKMTAVGKLEPLDHEEVDFIFPKIDDSEFNLTPDEEAEKEEKDEPATETNDPKEPKDIPLIETKLSPSKDDDFKVVKKLQKGATRWSQVIKYSFDGTLLAVGSHDKFIYIYDLSHPIDKFTKSPIKLVGHKSNITHLDFGILLPNEISSTKDITGIEVEKIETLRTFDSYTFKIVTKIIKTKLNSTEESPEITYSEANVSKEDIVIQSSSVDDELLFWRIDGKSTENIKSALVVRDVWWATYSCLFGWPVQGIWPSDESSDNSTICAVARSHSWEKVGVVATVDSLGRVRLYNYPCASPGAADKCYRGHAKNTTNINFSYDDKYCVTLGGTDRSIFIWTTDILEEIRQREGYLDSSNTIDVEKEKADGLGMVELDGSEDFSIVKTVLTSGDESMAIKPWKGAIREPTDWTDRPNLTDPPNANLDLKFIYGYRGWDCRNNLNFADSSKELVYHIAGVGIVFDVSKQSQIINTEHDDDILCLSVHPEGHTVATGEVGKNPKIVLWDANTGVTISVIKYHKKGVSNIAFSADGSMVISVGMDEDSTVAVHNSKSGTLLGKGKAGRGIKIYTLSVSPNTFVTGGKNHVKFWDLPKSNSPGGELSSKTGIYNIKSFTERTVVSSAHLGIDGVTGMNDGSILLWKDRANTKVVKAHNGAVTSMCTISETANKAIDSRELGPRILSGGKDGFIHLWNNQFVQLISIDLKTSTPESALPEIQSVAFKEDRILIGTKASEIYDLNLRNTNEIFRRVQGHFMEKSEVWGLDVHPSMERVVTCGDDKTVRLWDYCKKNQISIANIGSKARAVAFNPDGSQLAVGTLDGKIVVLSNDLKETIKEFTLSTTWIQTLSFSPDGKLLAVGAHDCIIYLLETKSYSCLFKFKGHHSFITGIDFSTDSSKMQSVSGDYELLFWDCLSGRQILSATSMRDVKWAKCTCILGWSVQGIWPANADGTDVNAVDRSPDGKYLVSGDDFKRVKLFQYPCPREKTKFKEYKGVN